VRSDLPSYLLPLTSHVFVRRPAQPPFRLPALLDVRREVLHSHLGVRQFLIAGGLPGISGQLLGGRPLTGGPDTGVFHVHRQHEAARCGRVGLRIGAGIAGRLDPALPDILLDDGKDLGAKLSPGPLVGGVGGDTGQGGLGIGADRSCHEAGTCEDYYGAGENQCGMEGRARHVASSGKGDGGILKAGSHELVTAERQRGIGEGRRKTEDGRRESARFRIGGGTA